MLPTQSARSKSKSSQNILRNLNLFKIMKNFSTKQQRGKPKLKFILFLTFIGLFSFVNPFIAHSQELVTIKTNNFTLIQVLKLIETQHNYSVVYNTEQVSQIKGITINLTSVKIEKVLDECLKNSDLKYTINKRTIVISQDEKKKPVLKSKTREISGAVLDEGKKPLVGAYVILKSDGKIGAITDNNGQFKLKFPDSGDQAVVVSYVGMNSCEVPVTELQVYQVILTAASMDVKDVVVTGIFNKAKESYTGAVSVITEKELKTFGNRNLLTTLKNIDPAFNILENNEWGSDPNKLPEVEMRGANSLPNVGGIKNVQDNTKSKLNTPVIILDGFEISLQRMMDLDQNEVSTITLLKDGSATAMYGSRGANGVIVITTKVPESGKLKFSYNGSFSLEIPDLSAYDLLNSREKLDLEYQAGYFTLQGQMVTQQLAIQKYYEHLYEEVTRGVDTYWLSKPLRTGFSHRHNIKVDGGDSNFRYAMTLQYGLTSGVMKKSERQNFNGGINLSYTHNKLIFRNNIMIGVNQSSDSPYGSFSEYVSLNPYWRPYDEDGKLLKILSKESSYYQDYKFPTNPMYNASLSTFNTEDYINMTNNFSIEWRISEDLKVNSTVGIMKEIKNTDDFKPKEHTAFSNYRDAQQFRRGSYDYSTGNDFEYNVNFTINYSKVFNENHNIYVGLNGDLSERNGDKYLFRTEGFSSDDLSFLPMALQYTEGTSPNGSEYKTRRVGILGNLSYMYANRYFVDGSYRLDGSSQFGSNKRFAPFWSVGLGWNIHNEDFMKNATFVDRLKLRGSYGYTGSQQFESYQAMATYQYLTGDRYKYWQGVRQIGIGNKDLEWQITKKIDIGIEASFFNNRLNIEADIYMNKTSNLLSTLELPYANGFSNYTANIGKLENKGFELKATAYLIRNTNSNIFWTLTGAIVRNKDKIVKLSQEMKEENDKLALVESTNPNQILREGASQNEIYVVQSLGIDPGSGKELFLNRFGEVTYDWDSRDRVSAGLSQPKYRGNISTMFRYKDLSMNISFGYRFGGQKYNSTLIDRVENADTHYNVDRRVYEDRWMKEGDVKFFKGIKELEKTLMSSRFVQNESTFNCQNINITYEMNEKAWMRKVGLQAMRFSADMGDVFYISTVRQERGISYPYALNASFTIALTF